MSMKPEERDFLQKMLASLKSALGFVALFSFFINLLLLTAPLYMLQIFDRVLTSYSKETLLYLTLMAFFALAIMALLEIVRALILVKVSRWLDNRLSTKALLPCADTILRGSQYGAQCLKDIAQIRQFLSSNAVTPFFDSPFTPLFLAVLFLLHPTLGFIGLGGSCLLFMLALANELITRKPIAKANAISIKNDQRIALTTRNAVSIQAMGMMPQIAQHWFNENEKSLDLQTRASKVASTLFALSKFIRFSLQIGIFAAGGYYVIEGILTPGAMIAASIIMARALAPIEQSIGSWKAMINARGAYRRLKIYFSQAGVRTTDITLPKPKGLIEFEGVTFTPPGREAPTLKQLNFQIKPGEMIGIIGPTAAGKSTLTRLMVGAWKPTLGNVRLDGAEIYHWERADLGRHIGYLPQDVELFPGTIAQNIARMQASDSETVIAASQKAEVHELILKLPEGYDTEIGEHKFSLSGGQQQRIALARALYGEPAVIVLDEPNANLDHEGEQAILNTLAQLKEQGKTVIVVAHRPNIIQSVDKLMIVKEGMIAQYGPKAEVLALLQKNQPKAVEAMPYNRYA